MSGWQTGVLLADIGGRNKPEYFHDGIRAELGLGALGWVKIELQIRRRGYDHDLSVGLRGGGTQRLLGRKYYTHLQ